MGQGDNPMEKFLERFLSSVIILFALGFTEVQAKEATTSDCEKNLSVCHNYSYANDCHCKDPCDAALKACFKEKNEDKLNGQANLESAKTHKLHCKQICSSTSSTPSSKGE